MKKAYFLFMLIAVLAIPACSVNDDEGTRINFEVVKIDSVIMADMFSFGETQEITIRFETRSTCHSFSGFDVIADGNVRTVYAVASIIPQGDCPALVNTFEEQVYRFRVSNYGSYVFRFYTGDDENGVPMFLERQVFVN